MKVEQQIDAAERLSLRMYYAASTITDASITVVKIVATIFSSFFSSLFLGKSKVLNEWTVAHIKDTAVSAQMTWAAAKGIFFPQHATDLRDALDTQGVHGLGHFKYKVVSKMNFLEKLTLRLHFVINIIKELYDTAISGIRYGIACVFRKILESSKQFERITFNDFLILSSHTAYLFGSCEGVIRPKTVNLKMVKA